jgi:hypothetical protein
MEPHILALAVYWQYGRAPLRVNMSIVAYLEGGGGLRSLTRRLP